jgi:hypothetical protein
VDVSPEWIVNGNNALLILISDEKKGKCHS